MPKLSLVICAVLLVSVAYGRTLGNASSSRFERDNTMLMCEDSLNQASERITEMHSSTTKQLSNPHDKEIVEQILKQATELIDKVILTMSSSDRADGTVESAFGDIVYCYKDMAYWVRDVTDQVVYEFNYMVDRSK